MALRLALIGLKKKKMHRMLFKDHEIREFKEDCEITRNPVIRTQLLFQ